MKNKILKSILAYMLVFTFIITLAPAAYAEEEVAAKPSDEYNNAISIINVICPDFPLTLEKSTTRAEFVAAIARILNVGNKSAAEGPYGDVPANHEYVSEIAFAKGMGLISEADAFNPDNAIKYTEALKILVSAIGYGEKALYNGAYPLGYLNIANDLDITKGISLSNDSSLTHETATVLIFNTICTDVAEQTSFGTDTEYTTKEGRNILSIYYDIYIAEGLVTANAFTGLKADSKPAGESLITLGNKYTFYGDGYDEFIGRRAKVFYRDDTKNTIVHAFVTESNEYSYTSQDDISLSGLTLSVRKLDSNSEKTYKLDGEYALIYNGKYLTAYDYAPYLKPESGSVTLVDYDEDNIIELIIVKDIEYSVISNVNIIDLKIYDAYKKAEDGGTLDLGIADYYSIEEDNGTKLTIRDLKPNDTLGIIKSQDSKRVEIIRYNSKIGGVFTEKTSDGKLYMDGEEYILSKYYSDNVKGLDSLKLNSEIIASVGVGNVIIYISEFTSGINYGYIVEVGTTGNNSMSEKKAVRLFGSNGKMNILPFAKNIKINGETKSESAAYTELETIASYAVDAGAVAPNSKEKYLWRVVKYQLNSKGELTGIWTTADKTVTYKSGTNYDIDELKAQVSAVYGKKIDADSQPVLFDDNTTHKNTSNQGKIMYSNGMFYPFIRPASDIVMLKVPEVDDTSAWKDEKLYSSPTMAEFDISTGGSKSIKCYCYDVDVDGAHLVIWVSSEGSSADVDKNARSGIIESVTTGVNPDGEKATLIKLYNNKQWEKLYALPEGEITNATVKNLLYGSDKVRAGDIVRLSLNSNREIVSIECDFTYIGSDGDGKQFLTTPNASSVYNYEKGDDIDRIAKYDSEERSYYAGYVYSVSGSSAMLVCNRTKSEMESENFGVVHMKPIDLNQGTVVFVKFDRSRQNATVYTEPDFSTVESYYTSGMNADFVVRRGNYYSPSMTIIYTN